MSWKNYFRIGAFGIGLIGSIFYFNKIRIEKLENKAYLEGGNLEQVLDAVIYENEFNLNGKNIDYNIIFFEKENESAADILKPKRTVAWLDSHSNNVYINLSEIRENVRAIRTMGSIPELDTSNFRDYMFKELYSKIIERGGNKSWKEFLKIGEKMLIKSIMDHERAHFIFQDEKMAFLYEIAENPESNSWVFLTTEFNIEVNNLYKEFENYRDGNNNGYTKERLMQIEPGERSMVAKAILSKITPSQK